MSLISSRAVQGRCPVCGESHASCGTAQDTVPVDQRVEVAAVGGPLKKYEVVTPHGVTTTMKLNEADARRLGVLDAPATEPEDPADGEETAPATKNRAVRNKSRTAADKGGAGGGDD